MIELINEGFAKNIYSQCGEDGILDKIFSTLGVDTGRFVEFGGWDGIKFSNCYNLARNGWSGLYIEANKAEANNCVKNMKKYKNVYSLHSKVSLENDNRIDKLLSRYDISSGHPLALTSRGIELMSIDIDSYDYWVFASLVDYRPKIIIIESLGRSRHIKDIRVKKYDSGPGCSLNAMVRLGYYKEYEPIAITGSNVIFIRKEDNEINGEKIFKISTKDDDSNASALSISRKGYGVRDLLSKDVLCNSFNESSTIKGEWIINPRFSWKEYEY